MLVIRKMEAGEKRPNVCSSFGLALATVSTIMVNAEEIKQSVQKTKKLRPSNVSYTRNFNTFTAIVDLSRSNFSIARTPLFQLKSAT